jgi:hypothetical protein
MDAAEPAIATADDGSLYVAWVEHRAQKEADVWLVHLSDAGQPLDQPVRVNPRPGQATAWRGDPPTLGLAKDGTLYVGWTARIEGEEHASDIYLSVSRDRGRSFEAPLRANDDGLPVGHGMHSLAVGPEGRVYLAWLDERNVARPLEASKHGPKHQAMESNRELFFTFSAYGGRSLAPNKRLAREVCPCCKTSLATGPGGRVYAGWRQVLPGDYRHIGVASSSDGGQNFSEPVIVSDDRWSIPACPVSGPALSVAGDGSLRVVWYTAGERGAPGLYWSTSDASGQKFSERKQLAGEVPRGMPYVLAGAKQELSAVWEETGGTATGIHVARMFADGKVASAAIARGGQLPAAAFSGEQIFIVYIRGEGERRAIWLTRVRLNAQSQNPPQSS